MFKQLAEALNKRERLTRDRLALRIEQHKPKKEEQMLYDQNITANRPKPVPLEGYVTNFTRNGAAFVREFDGNRDIFVPVTIVEKTRINRGDRVFAMAVPNKLYDSWKPELGVMRPAELFAIHLLDAQEYEQMAEQALSDEALEEPTLEDRIVDVLNNGPANAATILQALNEPDLETRHVFDALASMHEDGEVSRATIKQRADQKQASYVIWALNAKQLIPADQHKLEIDF